MKLWILPLLLVVSQLHAQKQGIVGQVTTRSGNQMPGPGKVNQSESGAQRVILIYELTSRNQTTQNGKFHTAIKSRLVKQARSNRRGKFKVRLAPGFYSVFVQEAGGLYANQYDDAGIIQPVTVLKGKFSQIELVVDADAVY